MNTGLQLRPGLRLIQAACGVWVTWTLLSIVLAQSAAADNCSVFTDCFGVANSAVEAAFGLSLLAVLSLVLDFVPFVGTAKGVVEAITGRDLLTGEHLAPWQRALGILPFVGKFGDLAGLAKFGNRAADLGDLTRVERTERFVDDVGDVASESRQITIPPAGTTYNLPSRYDPLVDLYRDANATASERALISEALGEAGGLHYVQHVTGNPAIDLLRPTTDADVAHLIDAADNGQAWDQAVAFGGRNATNVVYFDGKTMHIVEAKGGAGQYIDRNSVYITPGQRIGQTDPKYPLDVAHNMSKSRLSDGRNDIGDLIKEMYRTGNISYVGVRVGPYQDLLGGNPRIIIEKIFR